MIFDAQEFTEFFSDITESGYHIFSRTRAREPKFYPNEFPLYPKVDIADLKPSDTISIRVFFAREKSPRPRVDSGYINLEVESVDLDSKKVFGNIITQLPKAFALSKGTSIELDIDEVLYKKPR